MSAVDDLLALIRETPKYLSHITVSRIILDKLISEINDLHGRILALEKEINDRRRSEE